jgi:hypothetical protein
MPVFKDLSGQKFNMLTVIKRVANIGNCTCYECECDCGEYKIVKTACLTGGNVKSCGCLWKSTQFKTVHNLSNTQVYHSWAGMKKRCSSPIDYPTYTENNIKVCDEWLNSFEAFFKDMGHPPTKKHTLDRIENLKGYYKENCRWATTKEQNRNYSQNKILEANGQKMSVTEWAEKLNVSRFLIYNRLVNGWSVEKALFTPKMFTIKRT